MKIKYQLFIGGLDAGRSTIGVSFFFPLSFSSL